MTAVKELTKDDFAYRLAVLRKRCSHAGWAGKGDGDPLAEASVWQAAMLAAALVDHGWRWPYCYPALCGGGLTLEWSTSAWEISVEVGPTGEVFGDATMVRGGQETFDFETTIERALPETLSMLRAAGLLAVATDELCDRVLAYLDGWSCGRYAWDVANALGVQPSAVIAALERLVESSKVGCVRDTMGNLHYWIAGRHPDGRA